MIDVVLLLLAFGLMFGFRQLPVRVDAGDVAERVGQHCRRISFVLFLVPTIVVLSVILLLIERCLGGPGLLAFKSYFSVAGRLWIASCSAGILFGISGCFPLRRHSDGYLLIAIHIVLLFLVVLTSELQYAGRTEP